MCRAALAISCTRGRADEELSVTSSRFAQSMAPPPKGSLSFPPLLTQWKGAAQGRSFPGSSHTWQKALAPRPLAHAPSEQTLQDLQLACGPRWNLLQEAAQLPSSKSGAPLPPPVTTYRSGGGGRDLPAKMPLYETVWPDTQAPTFSVWDYCKKVGHAPPPNSMPAPRITDMKVRAEPPPLRWHNASTAHPKKQQTVP